VLTHSFIRTASGAVVYIEKPEQMRVTGVINITDIAHALSHSCRYNGHTSEFYSIAQHSCLIADLAEDRDAQWALLHDAAEAYMGDLVSPLKRAIKDVWKPLEARWDGVLRFHFDVWPGTLAGPARKLLIEEQEKRVKALDILMLGREMIDLMPFGQEDQEHLGYLDDRRPSDIEPIVAWTPTRSRDEFLARFQRLFS
jgi:5'-deoxynucleotidase YfbR-like HD superfamily hydrolase